MKLTEGQTAATSRTSSTLFPQSCRRWRLWWNSASTHRAKGRQFQREETMWL